MHFTAVYKKFPGGYAAFVEELPGANTQGKTLQEARRNLAEAVRLVLETNRQLAEESIAADDVIREPLPLSGGSLARESRHHDVYVNRANRKCSTVPRHREVIDLTARKICRDLEVPEP